MHTLSRLSSVVLGLVLAVGCDSDPNNPDGETGGNGGSPGTGGETTDTGGNAPGGGNDQGGSGAGAPSFEGLSQIDGSGTATVGSADIAIGPDGTVYASWVDNDDVFVARSTDGGETFESRVMVDDASIIPLVSMARHPYVAATSDRIAVVFNDEAGTVYLYTSPVDALAFGQATIVGTDVDSQFRDFPKPIFLADGSLAIAFQAYPATGARIFVSRESTSWTTTAASSGAPGVPCECCPLDLMQTGSGDVMVAFRNNDADIREMWLARAPAPGDTFSGWAPVSSSEGFIDSCPMQGPRLAELEGGLRVATWSSRGETAGRVFFSSSSDGGATWSGGISTGAVGDEPTIAVGDSGMIYITGVTGSGKAALLTSTDGGATWSAPEALQSPDGDLGVPQAEGRGTMAALAAVSSAGTVWLQRME